MSTSVADVFAERVKSARIARGLTQAELAERCGLASEAYGRLERGLSAPRADTVASVARALGVSADHLLGLPTEPVPLVARDTAPDTLTPSLRRALLDAAQLPEPAQQALAAFLRTLTDPAKPSGRRRG